MTDDTFVYNFIYILISCVLMSFVFSLECEMQAPRTHLRKRALRPHCY